MTTRFTQHTPPLPPYRMGRAFEARDDTSQGTDRAALQHLEISCPS